MKLNLYFNNLPVRWVSTLKKQTTLTMNKIQYTLIDKKI
jgi:hypothetical protein